MLLCWKKTWNHLGGRIGNRLFTVDLLRFVHYFKLPVLMFDCVFHAPKLNCCSISSSAKKSFLLTANDMELYVYLIKFSSVRSHFLPFFFKSYNTSIIYLFNS